MTRAWSAVQAVLERTTHSFPPATSLPCIICIYRSPYVPYIYRNIGTLYFAFACFQMAANPLLAQLADGVLSPVPFPGELWLLHRDGVEFAADCLQSCGVPGLPASVAKLRGRLFLSNIRIVIVLQPPAPPLAAFDFPLLYIRAEQFRQPIFGANYLRHACEEAYLFYRRADRAGSGTCFSVAAGGPAGSAPPHTFTLTFKEGGCGVLLPLFFDAVAAARQASEALPGSDIELRDLRTHAYVDPSDPSVLFIPGSRRRAGVSREEQACVDLEETETRPPEDYPGLSIRDSDSGLSKKDV